MKTLPWKKIAAVAIGIAAVVAAIFYFNPTNAEKPAESAIDPAFGEHISTFTAGVLPSSATISITLAIDAIDSALIGSESTVKLFNFTPSVQGKTVWLDKRTVIFEPEGKLMSGQIYEVEFYLSKLVTELPGNLSTFQYTFQVIPQNFEVSIENVLPYVKTELKKQKIEGSLLTADLADNAAVEKMVAASQDGRDLKIVWTHNGNGKEHHFIVEEVERKGDVSKVKLKLSGSPIGTQRSEEKEVEIPSLSDFKLMAAKVVQNPQQYVVLQFSDPLKEKQDITGLITIDGLPDLDFDIQDNEVWVYPPVRQTGLKTVSIEPGIRNILDYKMREGTTTEVTFEQMNPAVRFKGKGNILPGTNGLIVPFEAVNLKSVEVKVVRIYENNVLQFLQVNDFDGQSEIRRVAKPVLKKKIILENAGITDIGKWNGFTLDLSSLIEPEPGAIYQVSIGFKKADAAMVCEDAGDTGSRTFFEDDQEWSEPEQEGSYWDSYEEYYYDDDYDWDQRSNPCHSSYYIGDRNIKRNILASDLGILAKRGGDGNNLFFVNDLKTTRPMASVTLELYNFQQQLIGTATTDTEGKATIASAERAFAVIAKNGTQRGYLKLFDGESLSLSNFDISGEQIHKGLKGFLYGERGVWRPGDSLFLTFILEDKLKLIPKNHPVVFELQNPQGQVTNRIVRSTAENGFYNFATATADDAPTGNWTGRVKVGGTEFAQTIKIETIKPNRLKINLDFGKEKITADNNNVSGDLIVNWLHGAPGRNLKAQFEVLLTKAETKFDRYPDYSFEDPSREFYSEAQTIFDGSTDSEGHAVINTTLQVSSPVPGMLNAVFRGKVFEESGNFSIDRFSLPFYPYQSFTGIRVPSGDKARGMLLTDTTHQVDVVTVDADGKPVSREGIEMSFYKLRWRWWWDNSGDDAVYMSDSYSTKLSEGTIRTTNGKGKWKIKVKYPDWGRYLVKAYDPVSGHSTAKVIYIDWPGWAGRSRGGNEGATMLTFSSDKQVYNIGEKATVMIPGSGEGRALVSIENGSKVIRSYWVETQKGDTPFNFDITSDMTPNVFVNITLLQPHGQTINDLPMRLYGVIPIRVEDPATHLEPVISMASELEPGKEVVIKVSEKTNRKMTYTVAMVDEGLLDLTRFKTPDAWKRFYAREALGVKTWDLYDHVMGAPGNIERLLAIGGDEEIKGKDDDAKSNRFKPVVKFLGPFTLSGSADEHRFIMPQYIGSVKTMVVAGYEGAYGSAEKATPVRKPLMVLATLPRVLGPEETLTLPVTIFTMQKNIRNVKIQVKTSGPLEVKDPVQNVTVSGEDMTVNFDLAVRSMLGAAKVEVTASSGNYTATDVIEIMVRNPNPPVSRSQDVMVEAGKTWEGNANPVGMAGTNSGVLEVSNMPPINLGQRLRYLLQYPYGCIEQTTSSVFPQLYVDMVKVLTDGERAMIQTNVRAGIERLKGFQQNDGGFGYWPGAENADSWSTTYAGHFLIEAEARGYFVPNDMIRKWKKFQKEKAHTWRKGNSDYYHNDLLQAYRLYALALAGDADMGSMNRLREQKDLTLTATWMLAAAYAKAGQPEAAKKIIANLSTIIKPYQEMAYSYGSDLRDKAIILETLILLNDRTRGFELLKDISQSLSNSNYWMSTQSVAWCLKSAGSFANAEKRGDLKFTYAYNGKETRAQTELPIAQVTLDVDKAKNNSIKVVNSSGGVLFVRVITEGTPARGQEQAEASNLNISVAYTDVDGNNVDLSRLSQGTEFIASVTVTNPDVRGEYKNLALNQIFPSGWEINNLRLDEAQERLAGDKPTYQDIRDDRVYTYFDLASGQQKTFKVLLTASYAGTFYLPSVSCEAMYDGSVYAREKGMVVAVVKEATQ